MFFTNPETNKEYRITFQYPNKHSKKRCRVKVLLIEKESREVVVGESKANLKSGDEFNIREGQLIALERALSGFPRIARKEAWKSYWERGCRG